MANTRRSANKPTVEAANKPSVREATPAPATQNIERILIDESPISINRQLDPLDHGLSQTFFHYAWADNSNPAQKAELFSHGYRLVDAEEVKQEFTEREKSLYEVSNGRIFFSSLVLMRCPIRQYMALQAERIQNHQDQLGGSADDMQYRLEEILSRTTGITSKDAPKIRVDPDHGKLVTVDAPTPASFGLTE